MDGRRYTNAPWLRQGLQAGSDIDAVAQQVAVLDHDVAQIDANTEQHLPIGRQLFVAGAQRLLNFQRGAHRFDRAGEFGQDAIARRIGDAAAVQRDNRIGDAAIFV